MDCTSRQLRVFLLVAQHRSFTRAAELLFMTPSGLSVLVRELENQVGFRLFDRTTRFVEPRAQGTQLLPVVQQHVDQLDEAVARIGRDAQEGRLRRNSCSCSYAFALVPMASTTKQGLVGAHVAAKQRRHVRLLLRV